MSAQEIRKPNTEIANQGEPHCACVLLIDTSGSMSHSEEKLNKAIADFIDAIKSSPYAKGRVEPMVMTFNSNVDVKSSFGPAYDYIAPKVTCKGMTRFYAAIGQALDEIELRKKEYKDTHTPYYRPWLMVFTDGFPTDVDQGVSDRLIYAQTHKKVTFYSCAIGDDCDVELLKNLHKDHITFKTDYESFQESFKWLSNSMSEIAASSPGAKVNIPDSSNYQFTVES